MRKASVGAGFSRTSAREVVTGASADEARPLAPLLSRSDFPADASPGHLAILFEASHRIGMSDPFAVAVRA